MLLGLAIAFYIVTVVACGLGYTGAVRGGASIARVIFAISLLLTLLMIIVVGIIAVPQAPAF
jgi:uncharacterized membrane protein YtjA (UPF0391 family)